MGLTEEQKQRIEAKKAEALAKLKNKNTAQTPLVHVNNNIPPPKKTTFNSSSKTAVTSSFPSANKAPSAASSSINTTSTLPAAAASSLSSAQKEAIEKKRLEALQRKRTLNGAPTSPPPPNKPVTNSRLGSLGMYISNSNREEPSQKKPSIVNYFKNVEKSVSTNTFYSGQQQGSSKPSLPNHNPIQKSAAGNVPSKIIASSSVLGFGQSKSKVLVSCTLVERNRFEVRGGYHEGMINIFNKLSTRRYNATTRTWSFQLDEHDKLVKEMSKYKEEVELTPLPSWILSTFLHPKDYHLEDIDLSRIEQTITDSLMPFQREGIRYGVSRKGRVLIADDMGLGKTIQALGLASYFMDAWPFLVVAPSSMRYTWETSILRWFPFLTSEHVTIITTGKDSVEDNQEAAVVIISYDLLSKKSAELMRKGFNLVIMDESHCIKNDKSARTKAAEPLMQKSKYLILLTGTPALSRPIELYSQISALQPGLFRYAKDFGYRYCNGQLKKFGPREVYDFTGSSNMEELSLLLQERCMIRRLKADVLTQLPSKQRMMVLLDPSSVDTSSKNIKQKEKEAMKKSATGLERRGLLLEWYAATASAKLKAVKEYIAELISSGKKFILFCHHQVMLAGLKETLEEKSIEYILIDGTTPSELRKTHVDRFQRSENCQVALLSITAANSGLTLTAAHLVVFAELFWNPGILTQAEDRAHRIGQTDSVTVQYLVAKGTADDELWPMIQKKLDVLNKAGLSKDNFQDSESKEVLSKGQKKMEDYFSADDSFPDDLFDDDWDSDLANMQ